MSLSGDGAFALSAGAFYAIIWVFTSVAVITTALRLYTRAHIVRSLGLDDALMLFGQVLFWLNFSCFFLLTPRKDHQYSRQRFPALAYQLHMAMLHCRTESRNQLRRDQQMRGYRVSIWRSC